jgi:hypothetical protein
MTLKSFMNMSARFGYKYLLLVVIGATLFCSLLVNRYRTGANYLAVHVNVESLDKRAESDCRVFVYSPFGTSRELAGDATNRGLHRSPFSSPVSGVVVVVPTGVDRSSLDFEVRCGESWISPSRTTVIVDTELASVDALPEGVSGYGVRLAVKQYGRSLLPTAAKTVNWQGDSLLLMVPALQTLLLLGAILTFLFFLRRLAHGKSVEGDRPEATLFCFQSSPVVVRFLLGFCWISGVAVVGHHALLQCPRLTWAGDAVQLLVSVICILSVMGSSAFLAYWSQRTNNDRSIDRAAIAVIVVIIGLKVVWLLAVDTFQLGDYGVYWNNAVSMAKGEWSSLSSSQPLQSTMTTRAFPYFFPLASLLGEGNFAIETGNLLLQSATLVLSYLFGRSALGKAVSLSAIPLIATFPDYWFGLTLATHDVPAMFLLMAVFCGVEFLRRRIHLSTPIQNISVGAALQLVLCAVAIGVVGGILDVQRSYWPFLVGGLFAGSCVYLTRIRSLSRAKSTLIAGALPIVALLTIAVTVLFYVASTMRSYVAGKTGPTGSVPMLAVLSSYGSNTSAKWDDQTPWTDLYSPAVPIDAWSGVMLRKLAYEKIAVGREFWAHIFRKSQELSGPDFTMHHAHGGSPETYFPRSELISWYEAKQLYCQAVSLLLLLLFLLRLFFISQVPFSAGELFPLLFSAVAYAILLLLTQAVAVYDSFFGFTLAWSASTVFVRVLQTSDHSRVRQLSRIPSLMAHGTLSAIALCGIHLTASGAVATFFPPFFTLSHLPRPLSGSNGYFTPKIGSDNVSFAVSFAGLPVPQVPAGTWTGAELDLEHSNAVGAEISFFVSLDQRRRRQPNADAWATLPIDYEVIVGDRIVDSGPISRLSEPKFVRVRHTLPSLTPVKVVLRFTKSVTILPQSPSPVVAVEYIH